MDTALVTGGAGFIGSYVVDSLILRGMNVVVIDNLSTGQKSNILHKDIVFIEDDITSKDKVDHLFELHKPHFIFHLAAQISVSKSVREPLFDAQSNIMGTLNLLDAAVKYKTEKIVFSSTGGAMYGENPQEIPTTERSPEKPSTPYGIAKLATERYLEFYYKEYGLRYTSLRYANVYGPRQNPHGEAGVVAIFTENMIKGNTVTINGDGQYIRDYVYVEDVANANMLAMENGKEDVYNIGTGIGTSVLELFNLSKHINQYSLEPQFGTERPGDLRKSILSSKKAEQELNWMSHFSLEKGLIQTHDYFASKLGL
ncbi:MAG TPA: NAD-dependent epimerase/dehydratase family protein [Thermotogota bacterium]|nr:NAD-dependent epimerase/dehydratase family protein [Thermotogota bacterium]